MKIILPLLLSLMVSCVHAATKHDIEILKFKFTPAEITIQAGDTIRWTNKEKRQYHSVWFEQLGEPEPDYFFPDEFFERTFEEVGDFPYRCGPHPKMTGIVHVTPAGEGKEGEDEKPPATKEKPEEATPDKSPEKETPEEASPEEASPDEASPKKATPEKTEEKDSTEKQKISANKISQVRQEEILHILKHDCGSCHGMTLKGGLGPAITPDALKKLTEAQVVTTITQGRPGTPMPPWKPFFNEQETLWLAQHLKQNHNKSSASHSEQQKG